MYLMYKDREVLRLLHSGEIIIIREDLLPWQLIGLRDRKEQIKNLSNVKDYIYNQEIIKNNMLLFKSWLLTRNSKHNSSELDNYWTKIKDSNIVWEYVNLIRITSSENNVLSFSKADKSNRRLMLKTNLKVVTDSDDLISYVTASHFKEYCERTGRYKFEDVIKKLLKEDMNKMIIFDYLTNNQLRSLDDWGIVYESTTMKLIGIAPYNVNSSAFTPNVTCHSYSIFDEPLDKLALSLKGKHTFEITEKIKEKDFLFKKNYNQFTQRLRKMEITNE